MTKDNRVFTFNALFILGVLILGVILIKYNKDKVTYRDSLTTLNPASLHPDNELNNDNYEQSNELGTNINTNSTCNHVATDPSDLLPKNSNNEWSSMNPVTNDLKNINLLSAGANYGINTVGSSLRNPNLQLRSEPVISKTVNSPWNNTTIESDPYRRGLEIDGSD